MTTLFSDRKAQEQLRSQTEKVHRRDLETVLARQQTIERKVNESGSLKRFGEDIRLMLSMIRDYWYGNYRRVPWRTIAAVAGALLYVLNPLDAIPDVILAAGFLDDAGVVALCLKLVEADLQRYAEFKAGQRE